MDDDRYFKCPECGQEWSGDNYDNDLSTYEDDNGVEVCMNCRWDDYWISKHLVCLTAAGREGVSGSGQPWRVDYGDRFTANEDTPYEFQEVVPKLSEPPVLPCVYSTWSGEFYAEKGTFEDWLELAGSGKVHPPVDVYVLVEPTGNVMAMQYTFYCADPTACAKWLQGQGVMERA